MLKLLYLVVLNDNKYKVSLLSKWYSYLIDTKIIIQSFNLIGQF